MEGKIVLRSEFRIGIQNRPPMCNFEPDTMFFFALWERAR
jgi:hypothetical protein